MVLRLALTPSGHRPIIRFSTSLLAVSADRVLFLEHRILLTVAVTHHIRIIDVGLLIVDEDAFHHVPESEQKADELNKAIAPLAI